MNEFDSSNLELLTNKEQLLSEFESDFEDDKVVFIKSTFVDQA